MIFDAIRTRWSQVPTLESLVPAVNLILGEPIAGWPGSAVALRGYSITKDVRTSQGVVDRLSLQILVESHDPAVVEAIFQALRDELPPVDLPNGRKIRVAVASTFQLQRDPTSELFAGSGGTDYLIW